MNILGHLIKYYLPSDRHGKKVYALAGTAIM